MDAVLRSAPDVDVLSVTFPIPGMGFLPINAFVLHAEEPVLIDAGPTLDPAGEPNVDRFMNALSESIDPVDLRWIWITHTDHDHIGALNAVLEAAPNARVVTSFIGLGKMSTVNPLPIHRIFLLNHGQTLSVGDRTLTAFRPPSFDAPETEGLYDGKSGALFSSDCFGGLLSAPQTDLRAIAPRDLRDAITFWATVDAPWLHQVDINALATSLEAVRAFSPSAIYSAHLPPAFDLTEEILGALAAAPGAPPFVGPDQAAMLARLGAITGAAPSTTA